MGKDKETPEQVAAKALLGHPLEWIYLAKRAREDVRMLHKPAEEAERETVELLGCWLHMQMTPKLDEPDDLRTELVRWACEQVDWREVAAELLASLRH